MNERLEQYILEHIDAEPPLLARLRRDTYVNQLRPRMLSGHLQGRILKMLCRMIDPACVVEIGTFTGYSALCMVEGCRKSTQIHTFEINDELEDYTRSFFYQSDFVDQIQFHIGDALELLPDMDLTIDLAFIDGDKRRYVDYYHCLFPMIRKGGFILADNTLWDTKVIQPVVKNDQQTQGILEFNNLVSTDPRVETVILPLRDGLTLLHKK